MRQVVMAKIQPQPNVDTENTVVKELEVQRKHDSRESPVKMDESTFRKHWSKDGITCCPACSSTRVSIASTPNEMLIAMCPACGLTERIDKNGNWFKID